MSDATIGNRIKERLYSLGMNQSRLAEALGMTRANISYYVNDKYGVPDRILPKLATTLSCSEKWLKHGCE